MVRHLHLNRTFFLDVPRSFGGIEKPVILFTGYKLSNPISDQVGLSLAFLDCFYINIYFRSSHLAQCLQTLLTSDNHH